MQLVSIEDNYILEWSNQPLPALSVLDENTCCISYLVFWGQRRYPWSWVVWCPPGPSCPSSTSQSGTSGPARRPSDRRPRTGPGLERKRRTRKASSGRSRCWGPCLRPAPPPPSSGPRLRPSCCSPPALHALTCFLSGTGGWWWVSKKTHKDINQRFSKIIKTVVS